METRFLKRPTILLVLSSFILFNAISAQRSNRKKPKSNVEKFILAPFLDAISPDSVKIVTYLEIPYHSLQFIKEKGDFIASYQASIGIKNKSGEEVDYMVWTDSIRLNTYGDTKSFIKNRKHFAVFKVEADDSYIITGELQDLDTRKKGLIKKNISLQDMDSMPRLLKPNFMLDLPGDWGFTTGKIPTNGFRVREIGSGVDVNISGFISKDDFEVNIFLTNNSVADSLIQKFTGDGSLGYFSETIFIPATKFGSIKNLFRVQLAQGNKKDEKTISFTKYKTGISNYIYDTELGIRQMKYILTSKERKKLKDISKTEREDFFYILWKDRDPTPNTEYNELMEEYFGRIAYVNEHFSGWQPGWETDRGMIYILFGPPDEIQRTNSSMTNSYLYQVWSYYNINKQFIFRDQNGFGDFRLDTPFIGGG